MRKWTGKTLGIALAPLLAFGWAIGAAAGTPPRVPPPAGVTPLTSWAPEQRALFFTQDSGVPWLQHGPKDREWIAWGPMSREMVIDLDFSETSQFSSRGMLGHAERDLQKTVTDQIIRELGGVLKADWIPPADNIRVQTLQRRQDSGPVACATVGRDRMRMLLMAVPGKDYWIYVEQPEPLKKGEKLLSQSDLLLPDFFQRKGAQETWPLAQVNSRSFTRRRAFKLSGPYEPVRILLMHVRFPDSLDLTSIGYP